MADFQDILNEFNGSQPTRGREAPRAADFQDVLKEFGGVPTATSPAESAEYPSVAFGSVVRGGLDQYAGLNAMEYMTGLKELPDVAQSLLDVDDLKRRFPPSPTVVESTKEYLETPWYRIPDFLVRNPSFTASVLGESAAATGMALGAGGVGAGIGSLATPIGTAVGGIVGLGVGSAAGEYGTSFNDFLKKSQNVSEWDPVSLGIAFSDEDLVRDAHWYAAKRAGMVGLFDAISARMSGRIAARMLGPNVSFKNRLLGGVSALGVESAGGAGGEAAAQLLSTGQIDPREVVMEGMLEIFPGLGEAAVSGMLHRNDGLRALERNPLRQEDIDAAIRAGAATSMLGQGGGTGAPGRNVRSARGHRHVGTVAKGDRTRQSPVGTDCAADRCGTRADDRDRPPPTTANRLEQRLDVVHHRVRLRLLVELRGLPVLALVVGVSLGGEIVRLDEFLREPHHPQRLGEALDRVHR